MNNEQAAEILQDIFQHAVNSARAGPVTLANLPEKPRGRCVVIGAGKASAAMAAAVDAAWPDVAVSGVGGDALRLRGSCGPHPHY